MNRAAVAAVVAAVLLLVAGCAPGAVLTDRSERLQVVTTTSLLRDIVARVGGDRVDVASIVPDGADPHSYEPTLRDARNVVYADVAFSNYALLEEHSIIRTLDANLREDATSVSLAEEAVKYAAEIIPLVENISLDTVWLGLRVAGDGAQFGADRGSQVVITATDATGPGDVFAYLTGSFGETDRYLDSSDGFDASTGYRDDSMALPLDAHTHLSWAFTEPGVYTLDLRAALHLDQTSKPIELGRGTVTFAVGINPGSVRDSAEVVGAGHADITVDIESGELELRLDPHGAGDHAHRSLPLGDVVVDVPPKALDLVPAGEQFGFLGRPGTEIYQLPQAVLGKHIHGEIDPHLWQNVRNGMAYVQLVRDTLVAADPRGALDYHDNAAHYLAELDEVDRYLRETIADIPASRRHLITSHDAFGYLADAYDLDVAGFVTPNPAVEPSLADRRRLSETLRTLDIRAVFLEPNHASRSSTLTELATEHGIAVCPIYGDALDDRVGSYVEMMRFNADSLHRCLAPTT